MHVSDKLGELYGGYYDLGSQVAEKRAVAARQTLTHIQALLKDGPYRSALDIGAGEGAVLAALDAAGFADELHAVEISDSGVEVIQRRALGRLRSARKFDGYRIDAADGAYEIGTAIHVLEHVEHERAFLAEVTRVCDRVYIEVPLEMTARVERSIRLSGPYGHINFYNPATFRNLLRTAELEVLEFRLFAHSRDYETYLAGRVRGTLKHALRTLLLAAAPSFATQCMSYMAGAVVRRKSAR